MNEWDTLDEAVEDPLRPVFKVDKVVRALLDARSDFADQERKLLESGRLSAWIADLYRGEKYRHLEPKRLDDKKFALLTTKEYLYYYLYNAENWNQACSVPDMEAGMTMWIHAGLPGSYGNFQSERQTASLRERADEVSEIVVEILDSLDGASIKMLELICDFGIQAATLPLIEIYQNQTIKDDLILTTLTRLMRQAAFSPWISSPIGIALDEQRHIPLDEVNVMRILMFAQLYAAS